MTDLIDRQAAIDLFLDKGMITSAIYIERLPSAQFDKDINVPDKNVGKIGDLIDRQAAIDAILDGLEPESVKELRAYVKKYNQGDYYYGGILDAIYAVQDLPSAQPEIIRCKDCKHYLVGANTDCWYVMYQNDENDFCSRAERRTDE